jgi:DNA invertase Pin-like site-specific DNA recombinase
MNFAIWSAVSTAEQATPDKASLEEQEKKCRAIAIGKGWIETVPPYILSASRSFYVNLSDAERDIPRLRDMLDDARNDAFDVLVIYSYDRLGDLLDMVAQSLSFYGKQIYSISQPVEPQEPEHFDRYAAEAEAIMRDAARITQRFRISDLRRKRAAGMPKRIAKGLNPARVPFGYRWKSKKEPPDLLEQESELIIRLKDMFLLGKPVADLIRYANSTGIRPPNGGKAWQDSSIRAMLTNPFYAGFVSIKRFKTIRDPRRGHRAKQVPLPRSQWFMNEGLHQPLWDKGTWDSIAAEMDRRREANMHRKVRYPLTGILKCGVCGAKLHRTQHSHGKYRRFMWVCSEGKAAHIAMEYAKGNMLVSIALGEEIESIKARPKSTSTQAYRAKIEELQSKRKRIQEGYEAGGYDLAELTRLVNEISIEIERLEGEIQKAEMAAQSVAIFQQFPNNKTFKGFVLWVKEEDPEYVNTILRTAFSAILLYPDGRVEFIFR